MSFMPAEEDDNSDTEDGFFDYEDFSEVSTGKHGHTGHKHGSTGKLRQNGHKHGPNNVTETSNRQHPAFSSFQGRQPVGLRSTGSTTVSTEDLRMAIVKEKLEVLKTYLDLGLKVDEPLRSGWTSLMYAAHFARPLFVKLLLDNGAAVNYLCDMFSPLMAACSSSSGDMEAIEKCVKILIDAGAEVNAKDRFHTTSLMLASREGYLPVVKMLIDAGAEVNAQDGQGWTALTMATQRSRREVVVELLDSGADPTIRHVDKLTVKDLAAHLPTDEMLALLERRPANYPTTDSGTQQQNMSTNQRQENGLTSPYSLLDGGDSQSRLTDLRYGELEVFLLGLDLGHLVSIFQEQLIDLQLLMTLTEQDLINAGVTQVGARKKLLDAVQAIHKKSWNPSSLVSIHYNKKISCADAVAMVANSSRHLRYISSTMVYVREQLRRHTDTVLLPTDKVSPGQLLRHAQEAVINCGELVDKADALRADLHQVMLRNNLEPADAISRCKRRRGFMMYITSGGVLLVVFATIASLVWWKSKADWGRFLPHHLVLPVR